MLPVATVALYPPGYETKKFDLASVRDGGCIAMVMTLPIPSG